MRKLDNGNYEVTEAWMRDRQLNEELCIEYLEAEIETEDKCKK